jgi:hypothetical protein
MSGRKAFALGVLGGAAGGIGALFAIALGMSYQGQREWDLARREMSGYFKGQADIRRALRDGREWTS